MSKRVLVVEDEADIRRLVSIKLKGAGYEVSTANDGEEGLAAAVRDKPDLIVSDVMMPKKDGYTMVREVREALGSEAPVVIMLTSRTCSTVLMAEARATLRWCTRATPVRTFRPRFGSTWRRRWRIATRRS